MPGQTTASTSDPQVTRPSRKVPFVHRHISIDEPDGMRRHEPWAPPPSGASGPEETRGSKPEHPARSCVGNYANRDTRASPNLGIVAGCRAMRQDGRWVEDSARHADHATAPEVNSMRWSVAGREPGALGPLRKPQRLGGRPQLPLEE